MGSLHSDTVTDEAGYAIRVPLKMIQLTEPDGKVWPIEFEWQDENGERIRLRVTDVKPPIPLAEQKSGTVGDRYECVINGRPDYLYYTRLTPRKWFKVLPVNKEEYEFFYRLPDETPDEALAVYSIVKQIIDKRHPR